jgi:hypothetical protein
MQSISASVMKHSYRKLRKYCWLFILVLYVSTQAHGQVVSGDCPVCERLQLFNQLRQKVGDLYWKGFGGTEIKVPLVYFTATDSYLAFAYPAVLKDSAARNVSCTGIKLFKLSGRLDSIPFHMENETGVNDTTSLYYHKPFMFCSDVETMVKTVKVFKTTEEWLQLVLHEYFHSFQISGGHLFSFFSSADLIKEDSLTRIYQKHEWFRNDVKNENSLLLLAIGATKPDSTFYYITAFIQARQQRRIKFSNIEGYNISKYEDFWEKIEGTARYMEYYAAFMYRDMQEAKSISSNCDTLFNGFAGYADHELLRNRENFKTRSQVMPSYYYVTGFNMCKLLDKLNIQYKADLFDSVEKSLLGYVKDMLKKN